MGDTTKIFKIPPSQKDPINMFLLLENPGKPNNLGPIIRCASAFGIRTIVAIGSSKCNVEGSHGAFKYVDILAFRTGDQALGFLKDSLGCSLIVGMLGASPNGYGKRHIVLQGDTGRNGLGAEITNQEFSSNSGLIHEKQSSPVNNFRFQEQGNVCVALCKRGYGLPSSLAKLCDTFIHVPYPAPILVGEDRPLLDIPSCLSISLHEITRQLGFSERNFQGQKYNVAARTQHRAPDMSEAKRVQRQRNRDEHFEEIDEHEERLASMDVLGNKHQDGDY